MKLNKVPIDESVKILNLNCNGDLRRRMLDLGMVKGTKIKPVFRSPFGDPTAYEIRGTVIALRKEDAEMVFVEEIL